MSHGKFAKTEDSRLSLLDRLNNRLARLMGKRNPGKPNSGKPDPGQDPQNNLPSNSKFVAIILAMLVSLWLLTGVYYVQDNSYGLLLQQGRVVKVLNGLHIGVSWPYPFAEVVILDGQTTNLKLGKNSNGSPEYILSSDNQQLEFNADISYQISDPIRFFISYYQSDANLDQRINWLVMTTVQDYALAHDSQWLLQNSLLVNSNEIRILSDKVLMGYGLKLSKFSLTSIHNLSTIPEKSVLIDAISQSSAPLAPAAGGAGSSKSSEISAQLLAQAKLYQQFKAIETESIVADFNRLLPQYHANQQAIVELVYYKALSFIPESTTVNNYPLLNLNLVELEQFAKTGNPFAGNDLKTNQPELIYGRTLNRLVDRERHGRQFKDL